jgi:enoyl-CoA hydratase/carnithine racemase
MTQTDKILSRKEGGVGYLIFNNPERHNAVSLEMWDAASGILADFAADNAIRVVVLTGAGGKAFVSGADISKFESERSSKDAIDRYNAAVDQANTAVYEFPKPTIAMIRGYCIGGGVGLALCCDLRICSDNSKFGVPAAKLGLGYGFKGIKKLVDVVGPSFAKEIFFTARQFTAAEALQMGLVNRVLPDAEVEKYVKDYAETISGNAPLTVNPSSILSRGSRMRARDLKRCDDLVAQCLPARTISRAARLSWRARRTNSLNRVRGRRDVRGVGTRSQMTAATSATREEARGVGRVAPDKRYGKCVTLPEHIISCLLAHRAAADDNVAADCGVHRTQRGEIASATDWCRRRQTPCRPNGATCR